MLKKITLFGLGFAMLAAPSFALAQTTDVQSQIAALLAELKQLQLQLGQTQTQGQTNYAGPAASDSSSAACLTLTQNLYVGEGDATTNGAVTQLQQFLGINPTTGYFGTTTVQAVKDWQRAHNIILWGTASTTGFGSVGPRTRAAMACHTTTQNSTFTATPTSGLAPLSVSFRYDNATAGGTYVVTFGDGTTDTMVFNDAVYQTTHTYASAGTYRATLSPQYTCPVGSDGTATICNPPAISIIGTVTVTVNATKGANFTASPTSGTAPLQVSFTGPQSAVGDTVNFGDGTTGTMTLVMSACPLIGASNSCGPHSAANHTYTSANTYPATLLDSSGNTLGSVTITVTGGSTQQLSFTASPASGAAPLAVTFTSNTAGTVNFGDGTSGTLVFNDAVYQTTHTYTSANTYTATLSNGSACFGLICNSAAIKILGSVTITVTGGSTQQVSFTATPTSGAAPLSVQFRSSGPQGTNIGTSVNFGDGTVGKLVFAPVCSQCNAAGIVGHTYTGSGTYPATLLDSSGSTLGTVTVTASAGTTICPAIALLCPAGKYDQVDTNCSHTCVTIPPPSTTCNGANNNTNCSSTPTPVTPGSGAAPGTSSGSSQSSTNAGILSQMASALTAIEAILRALGAQ